MVWNKLLEVVIEVGPTLSFEMHLVSYIGKIGIEGYGPNAGNWEYIRGLKKRAAWTSWAEGPVSKLQISRTL